MSAYKYVRLALYGFYFLEQSLFDSQIITVPWNKGRVEKKTTPYWRLSDVSSAYQ